MQKHSDRDPKTGKFLPGHQTARKHGAFSLIPQERLRRAKAGWVSDIGPKRSDLTTSQRILIEKACFLLERTMCVEVWLNEHPELYGKMLARGLRDSYLAWCNTLRLTLRELGIDKKGEGRVLTPLEIAEKFDREKRAKEKEK